ncbi:MAG: hypothetical protein ACPGSW_00410 [Phaeobacter italicus]
MARTPATPSKSASKPKAASRPAASKPAAAAKFEDTKGAAEAAQTAQSPIAPQEQAPAAPGGGETMPPAGDAPTPDPVLAAPAGPVAEDHARIAVVCHRPDGRRRVGRRWPHGETIIAADSVSDFEIAQLEADPQFTISHLPE